MSSTSLRDTAEAGEWLVSNLDKTLQSLTVSGTANLLTIGSPPPGYAGLIEALRIDSVKLHAALTLSLLNHDHHSS